MKETYVRETAKVELKDPILVEGLPGMGMVGRIAVRFLIKQLGATRFAELYSPHFPYYVLVNKKGSVRLLRCEFFVWKNLDGGSDLVFLVGDSQAQTIEGQYEVTDVILKFASGLGVKRVFTVGGFREESEKPQVVAVATKPELLDEAVKAGAVASPAGNPIVGTAGLLLGLARFADVEALCLLGETRGYLPDPLSAKGVLQVLEKLLGLKLDYASLDEQVVKSREIASKMSEIEERREKFSQKMRRSEEGRVTYIS